MFTRRFQLENEISEIINNDNNSTAHFEWNVSNNIFELNLITYNPSHKTYFLLNSIKKQWVPTSNPSSNHVNQQQSQPRNQHSRNHIEREVSCQQDDVEQQEQPSQNMTTTILQSHADVYVIILEEMLEFIEQRRERVLTYMIEWDFKNQKNKLKQDKTKMSYFKGNNIEEALIKLYYGKDKTTIIIYNVKLVADT